ncbi:hypothetical protein ACHAXT_010944 [Thalassiosira profunda]
MAAGANVGATTAGGKYEPGSSPADDALARRRAELRRLQQRRGDGLALARSRLGGPPTHTAIGSAATSSRGGPGAGGGGARHFRPPPRPAPAAAPAAYLAPPTAATLAPPIAGAATPTPPAAAAIHATPPTEIVKRRLEGSYGPRDAPAQQPRIQGPAPGPFGQGEVPPRAPPPQSQKEQLQQRQRSKSQPPPRRGNQKRDSEIFAAGRRRQQQQGGQPPPAPTANAPAVGYAGSFDRSAARAAIGYTASFDGASHGTSPGGANGGGGCLQNSVLHSLTMASPRSPFGQPRKVAEVVVPDGRGVPFPAMPGLLPEDSVREAGETEPEAMGETEAEPAAEAAVAADLDAWVQSHSPPLPGKQRASVADSGKSTPVHSNSHTSGEAVALAAERMADAGPAGKADASRLAEELRRAEREKRAAWAQVDRLKTLLDETQAPKEEEQPKRRMTEGLLAQFRERIATHGEGAAVAWIAGQLERDAAASMSSPAKRGRSLSIGASLGAAPFGEWGGGDVLESVIPPLTPRGRPGSRDNLGELDEGRGKRVTTPRPKRLQPSSPEGAQGYGPEGVVEREYLAAAARTIPSEYGTRSASYFVRRPYADAAGEEEMWAHPHLSTGDAYRRSATASDPASLEVVARIEADGSVFTLAGASEARHGRAAGLGEEREWTVFADVEGRETALGRVAYIDAEGNERDYWLDSIYEEALTTRESYCTSMLSAAFALREVTGGGSLAALPVAGGGAGARPPVAFAPAHRVPRTVPPPSPMVPPGAAVGPPLGQGAGPAMPPGDEGQRRPPLRPAVQPYTVSQFPADEREMQPPAPEMPAVQTVPPEAAPKQPSTEEVKPGAALREESKPQTPQPQLDTKPQTKQPAEEEFEPADSALPFLVVSLFSLLFSLMWFVVKIPFRIGSALFTVWVTVAALRIVWLCFADDHGAYDMGAGIDWEFNAAGIH